MDRTHQSYQCIALCLKRTLYTIIKPLIDFDIEFDADAGLDDPARVGWIIEPKLMGFRTPN